MWSIVNFQDTHPPFDIHKYGEAILDKLSLEEDSGGSMSFTKVVKGQPKHDVARTFSALLQLVISFFLEFISWILWGCIMNACLLYWKISQFLKKGWTKISLFSNNQFLRVYLEFQLSGIVYGILPKILSPIWLHTQRDHIIAQKEIGKRKKNDRLYISVNVFCLFGLCTLWSLYKLFALNFGGWTKLCCS